MPHFINISTGKYYHSDSVIHHINPKAKLLSLILILISISITGSFLGFLAISLLLIVIIFLSRIPLLLIIRYIRPMLWLFASILLLHVFFSNSDEKIIFSIGFIKATWKGLYDGSVVCYRFLLIAIYTSIMVLTTIPIRLADSVTSVLSPLRKIKIPVDQIPMMMVIVLRFIPILFTDGEKLVLSQKIRGSQFRNYGILRLMPMVVTPLIRNSFRMADELAMSMESRCYGENVRTHLYELKFQKADYLVIAISFIIILFAILCKFF